MVMYNQKYRFYYTCQKAGILYYFKLQLTSNIDIILFFCKIQTIR
ncbi:hypothetical protein M23134_03660 [Microscilla marina ATCC 23134]|uniref:Uncharacterized protein n=1 Tax=Microscilla marina ATCC 23134 TaxID=313606 RepID=A1ZZC2_MICM2|nr:hypothetical protein M23134_03660 [Microscilla marina ATCC 23134]